MPNSRTHYSRQICVRNAGEFATKSAPAKSAALLFTLLALTFLSVAAPPAISTADPHRYLDDIKAPSAPAMGGRGAGSKGLTRAEPRSEKRYKSLGLEPAGTNSYLQPFTVSTGAQLKGKNNFAVLTGDRKVELKAKQDFVPFSFSASGSAHGPLVFAGYGVSADEFHYDDYAGIDVKDKIVVVLRYEPPSFGEKGGNQGMTQHSQLVTKAINAEPRRQGARAGERKAGRRRRRPAYAIRQRERTGKCRDHFSSGQE